MLTESYKKRLQELSGIPTEYYTTSRPMQFSEFIEIEVDERENYTLPEVQSWMKKYNITNDTKVLWVTTEPWIAASYQIPSENRYKAKEIYEAHPDDYDVDIINANAGTIVPESDDGDSGFIMVFES